MLITYPRVRYLSAYARPGEGDPATASSPRIPEITASRP